MASTDQRSPADYAAYLINQTNKNLAQITTDSSGKPRDLDGRSALSALDVSAHLAVAAALLAVADVIKEAQR
ncbi:hypothetical protein [Streptomyces sp. NPDC059928]|uniref:hypothetical protein n=1 Tax=unclassified Streptomyces TaxID=2593676 RepID=UPI0036586309